MAQNEHKLFVGDNEYLVQLVFSDYEGPLNRQYGFVFDCCLKGDDKKRAISIAVSDMVIGMWQRAGGNKEIQEDEEIFAWQLVQAYLPELEKKDVIKLFVHRDDNARIPEGFIAIKAAPTISETARSVVFAGKKPTNIQTRREILKVCYNEYQNNPHGFVHKTALLKFIPVTDVELERNIKYLGGGYYIKASLSTAGYQSMQITNHGIDVFADPDEFNRVFQLKFEQTTNYNVSGDMIKTEIIGHDNQNVVKSKIKDTG